MGSEELLLNARLVGQHSREVFGIPAGLCYVIFGILRLISYGVSLVLWCVAEPTAHGWSGCGSNPPTLSTVSSFNGVHGIFRCVQGLVCCVPMALVVFLCLRWSYCNLLDPPPLPITFTALLIVFCVMDVVQVATAHSTEHWIVAHVFFGVMILTMFFYFHGVFARPGMKESMRSFVALITAALLFLSVIALCIYMLVTLKFDQNKSLDKRTWVLVEYVAAFCVIMMHICLGIALPPHLKVSLCGLVLSTPTPSSKSPKSLEDDERYYLSDPDHRL